MSSEEEEREPFDSTAGDEFLAMLEDTPDIELIPDDPVYRRLGEYDQSVHILHQCLEAGMSAFREAPEGSAMKENAEAYVSSVMVSLRQMADDLRDYMRSFDNSENRRSDAPEG